MTEQEQAYHSALSQCAELLDNMPDGHPITDTPRFLAAKLDQFLDFVKDCDRFRWLNQDHDDDEVREKARYLARRLGTSSYFAITRDIDLAMAAGAARQGGNTSDKESPVLAQAGVRAEPAAWGLFWRHEGKEILQFPVGASKADCEDDLKMFDAAEQANMVIRPLTTLAQVPAAEVRAQALEEAAKLCDEMELHYSDYKDTALLNGDVDLSNAASGEPRACRFLAERIRSLAQSSTADKASEVRVAEEVEYELHQDDMMVAGTSGKDAFNEILRYAAQYVQDGPIELYKVTRKKVSKLEIPAAAPSAADSGNTDEKGSGK